jgi:flagellar biosynthetic protein FliR
VNLGLPLPQIAGEQLVAFLLVTCRVGGIFVFAPIFSSRMVPVRARAMVTVAIAVGLTPLAMHGQTIPVQSLDIAGLLVKELVVGLAFSLALGLLVAAAQAAGAMLDTLIGFSYAAIVDPLTNMQGGVTSQVYSAFAVMIFLFTGGDRLVILGLARSYQLLPLGHTPSVNALGSLATDELAQIAVVALEIAAPVLVALVVADVAFAIVARAVPQMNIYFVGLPLKILIGLGVVAASLPFAAQHMQAQIADSVLRGLRALAGG